MIPPLLPAGSLPVVCVLEASPYWLPELQRQFQHQNLKIRGCRKWSEFSELIRTTSTAMGIVDFTSQPAECLTGLAQRPALAELAPLIVVSSPRFAGLEWVLREAGIVSFFPDSPHPREMLLTLRRWLPNTANARA